MHSSSSVQYVIDFAAVRFDNGYAVAAKKILQELRMRMPALLRDLCGPRVERQEIQKPAEMKCS